MMPRSSMRSATIMKVLSHQEQYNSIVQSYETSIRSMSEQINVWKTSLKEQGYDWDSAVVTPNL